MCCWLPTLTGAWCAGSAGRVQRLGVSLGAAPLSVVLCGAATGVCDPACKLAVTRNADSWFLLNLVAATSAANIKGFAHQGWDEGHALCFASADLSVPCNITLYNAIEQSVTIGLHKSPKNKFLAHRLLGPKIPGREKME